MTARRRPTRRRLARTSRWPRARRSTPATHSSKVRRTRRELLEIKGIRETQQYLVEEVQKVYRDQGVSIHDKHIELIVRQMLRRVLVAESGESSFLPGERVDSQRYARLPTASSSKSPSDQLKADQN